MKIHNPSKQRYSSLGKKLRKVVRDISTVFGISKKQAKKLIKVQRKEQKLRRW